tara:strand:+ start:346 stop:810 length:465 start_codon:yes stop_codon:yes gene_type:complete
MFFYIKHQINKILLIIFFILLSCQLQEPVKNHGILFLENRANKLEIKNSNKNDALKVLGQPHTKSMANEDQWIYIERTLSKGKFHKLGQTIVKTNNVLVLSFDKYGILLKKDLYNKDDIKKISFSKNKTENQLSKRSFVESFLSSIKEKMYGNR